MEFAVIIAAYLVGSIPSGLVLGKLSGLDVRKSGSGNIGATNVGRLLGKKMGFLTLVCDVGKAVLPMLLAARLLPPSDQRDLVVIFCGAAAFLGHLFPLYLKFHGGKGVATALGIFLYLSPPAAVIDMLIFIAVVYNWGYVSLGSLSAALLMPGIVWLLTRSPAMTLLAVFVGVLIWIKHHENIRRLLNNEEKTWKKR